MDVEAVEIFCSFDDEDQGFYQRIKDQFGLLKQSNQSLRWWSKEDIDPGQDLAEETRRRLESAVIILLLISPKYLNAPANQQELTLAVRRQREEQIPVIPVRLRPGNYGAFSFARLKGFPEDESTVLSQLAEPEQEEVFAHLVASIARMLSQRSTLASTTSRNQIWTVPYPQNPLFTGREAELEAIRKALASGQRAAIGQTRAISGLGGIGKTQLALEYAYRHRSEYRYVFWVLADTRDTLTSGYLTIAEVLNLPGKHQAEQRYTIEGVKSEKKAVLGECESGPEDSYVR